MTVDEYVPCGEYWTRSGMALYHNDDGSWSSTCGVVKYTPEQMSLLIERDMHRDECKGIGMCFRHPVTHISIDIETGLFYASTPRNEYGGVYDSIADAMDGSYRLAVGE